MYWSFRNHYSFVGVCRQHLFIKWKAIFLFFSLVWKWMFDLKQRKLIAFQCWNFEGCDLHVTCFIYWNFFSLFSLNMVLCFLGVCLGLLSKMKFIFMVKSWTLLLDVEIQCHFMCQIIRIIRLLHSEPENKKLKQL